MNAAPRRITNETLTLACGEGSHGVSAELDAQGWALSPKLLSDAECDGITGLCGSSEAFRSRVVMARHGFVQVAVLLSEPDEDFQGGEFVLTEQRPRMQSRASVVPLRKGDAVVFAVNSRPVRGARGEYRVNLRHGVSQVRAGHRHTLGLIFHDAA